MFKLLIVFTILIASFEKKNTCNAYERLKCSDSKCDLNIKCKKDSSLKYANESACCPECVCDKCPDLDDQLCSSGFKAIKQPKLGDECCEIIACISNADNNDDLTFHIENSNEFKQDNSNDYLLENFDDDINDDDEHEIVENESYSNDTNYNDQMCLNYKCTDEKYRYYKHNLKCPKDSQLVDVNLIEKQCCQIDKSCQCNECPDRSEMIEWCKLAGANFEAVVVQKGESIPGKCCDVHICHSPNYTCNLNGIFYPHNSKWKLNACTDCMCEMGHIKCNKISCPVLDCEIKQSLTNECCPICTNECLGTDEKIYKSNETWKLDDDDCTQCKCVNGVKECLTESCPPLNCLNPIKIPGVCCQRCPDQDLSVKRYLKYPPHCKAKTEIKCNTSCHNGFKLDGNRCPTCECSENPIQKCSFKCDFNDLIYLPLNDRLCECSAHECPTNECFTKCLNGYEKDSDGCDTCKCKVEERVLEEVNKCVNEEDENKIWTDRCRECTCKNNQELCTLISCQKPRCSNPIFPKSSCCPICPDEEPVLTTNITTCKSEKKADLEDIQWELDKCTNCTCQNGLVLCTVNACKPTVCSNPILSKDTCCPTCPLNNQTTKPSKKYWSCVNSNDELVPHGTTWKENDCLHCLCQNGERKCLNQELQCPKLNCLATVTLKDECCPRCLFSLNSPFILSLVSNSTSFIMPNDVKYRTLQSNHIIYFLVIVVISLVILVIVLLLKILGITMHSTSEQLHKTKLIKKSTQTALPIHSPLLVCDSKLNDQFNNSNNCSELSFNNDDNSKSTLLFSNDEKTTSFNQTQPNRSICYI